jgi:hypothetical protein
MLSVTMVPACCAGLVKATSFLHAVNSNRVVARAKDNFLGFMSGGVSNISNESRKGHQLAGMAVHRLPRFNLQFAICKLRIICTAFPRL